MGKKTNTTETKWTETALYDLIAQAYPTGEWACLRHVRDGGGWDRRTCDALAMGLWPSRGLLLRGFEIKISKADFKREAKDPGKAEAVARFCDEWWIVTPPRLVQDPEVDLPPCWGLMEPRGGGLGVRRKATKLDPEPVSRGFLAQLFKGARAEVVEIRNTTVPRESIRAKMDEEYERGKAHGIRSVPTSDASRLAESVEKFRAATGINIGDYRVSFQHDEEEIADIIYAARVGTALIGEWGSEWPELLKYFKRASEKLATVHDRLETLVVKRPLPE